MGQGESSHSTLIPFQQPVVEAQRPGPKTSLPSSPFHETKEESFKRAENERLTSGKFVSENIEKQKITFEKSKKASREKLKSDKAAKKAKQRTLQEVDEATK